MARKRTVVSRNKRKGSPKRKAKIIKDLRTGLPVLTLGPGAPKLTTKQVAEILAEFP